MAEIRLNKLTRQFNIGLQTLVDFLNEKGAGVDLNPNAKVSDEFLPAIEKKFGDDLKAKQEAEKRDIKMKEIIERNTRKQQDEEDEFEPVRETIIKNTSLGGAFQRPEPKPEPVAQPEPEPMPEPVPVPEPVPEPEPEVKPVTETVPEPEPEARPAVVSEPVAEVQPEPTPEPEPEAEPEAPTAPAPEEPTVEPASEIRPTVETPAAEAAGLKVLGKVDLSQFAPKKKGKRERIKGGSQKVDVTKVAADDKARKAGPDAQKKGGKPENNKAREQQAAGKGRKRDRDRFKPAMTEAEEEEMQKEIQKQVKETYARMNDTKKNNFGAKYRKEKREAAASRAMEEMEQEMAEKKVLKVTEFVTVNDLATLMNNTPVNKVISACFNLGMMVSINQRLDAETLVIVAEEFGYKVEFVTAELTQEIEQEQETDNEADMVTRPPIITVMGHVDHGKTSLLDYIRKTNVIAGEAGGITQHIGAYHVELPGGRQITFLDTPGHEAFTAMRARGAQLTDLAIIIIAADDAVMPQTIEAINHAQAAGVPMVFAINKIDKPGAQPEKIYQQLAQMNILTEAWGGKYQCQEISAKKGINVDKLLDKVLLETDSGRRDRVLPGQGPRLPGHRAGPGRYPAQGRHDDQRLLLRPYQGDAQRAWPDGQGSRSVHSGFGPGTQRSPDRG